MNKEELEGRHKGLQGNEEVQRMIKENPDAVWSFADFLKKVSKRCRRCYSKIMSDVAQSKDVTKWEYYEKNLCSNCLTLARAKLEAMKK